MLCLRSRLVSSPPSAVLAASRRVALEVPRRPFRTAHIVRSEAKAAEQTAQAPQASSGKRYALHWYAERAVAASLVVLVPLAVVAPSKPVDYVLGVVIPLHAYWGLEAFVVDYVQKHKKPTAHLVAMRGLQLFTLVALLGCYNLNAADIGLTNAIKMMWSLH
eukprot:Unigene5153_Nuclearia_a/m.15803 Unigene5153_Nuclearia_a/g.15803  ORF Unigene5153_Nuclearia_a/g.15803 Unigene5153_Nuclearia_a/m.15803 type:complete len:162 (-) Unigene5153_Nuclearia_a:150-635(-)